MEQNDKPSQHKRRQGGILCAARAGVSEFVKKYRAHIKTAACMVALAALTAFVITYISVGMKRPLTVELYINGVNVGAVESERLVSDAENAVRTYFSEKSNGMPLTLDAVTGYEISSYRGGKILSYSDCYDLLYNIAEAEFTLAGALYIDGEFIAACGTAGQIYEVIDGIEYELLRETDPTENIEAVRIFNNVEVVDQLCLCELIGEKSELDELLRSAIAYEELVLTSDAADDPDGSVPNVNTVSEGEMPGGDDGEDKSSDTNSIKVSNSIIVNGDLAVYTGTSTPERYMSDEKTAIKDSADSSDEIGSGGDGIDKNGLTISVIASESDIIDVPYDTVYIESECYYMGTATVITKGIPGQSLLMYSVTYVDGVEVARELSDEIELILPVTEIICIGTAKTPECISTGTFIWPTTSRTVTSAYGMRMFDGKLDHHSGLDIAASENSSVYASDGGRVTYANESDSYGKHVIITHDNGYITLYAHLNEILVEEGDMVYQGQLIGLVGKTGRATGYHVHFEIRKNGKTLSPKNYLD